VPYAVCFDRNEAAVEVEVEVEDAAVVVVFVAKGELGTDTPP